MKNNNIKVSLWQLFRLVFVVFSLYLLGDAFSRWDGFSYYAPFSEFLPTVALAFILWSFVALLTSISVWLVFMLLDRAFTLLRCNIRFEHLFIYAGILGLTAALAWKGKKIIWPDVQTTIQVKLAVLLFVAMASVAASWLLRKRAMKWIAVILERITPLVWLFGLFALFAVPLVSYHALIKDTKGTVTRAGESDSTRPNIVLVTFDAMAASNMSAYGYRRETTPFIKEWAKKATIFNRVQAGSNFTTPAAASLMTGKRVWTHQTYHIEGTKPVRSSVESLPALLKDKGYFNVAFVVNPFASIRVLGMSNSFDIAPLTSEFGSSSSLFGWKFGVIDRMLYRAFGDKIRLHNWIIKNDFILSKFLNLISRNIYTTTVPPEHAFNRFIEIIDENIPKPFFAWIHLFPPHDPYLPPESFEGKFNTSREMRAYKPQERLIEESYKYLFQYHAVPENMKSSVDLMRDYYDEFILYTDKTFKDFIEELNKRKEENTVIILSADHGESFEHGYFTHGGPFLYEQVTHVPLIMKEPGQIEGHVVDTLIEQIDIPATILDLANIPVPSWMEGRSAVPLIRGESLPTRSVFSMNFEDNRSRGQQIKNGSIAVWKGDYKLIHYLERDESLLFNLSQDPDELDNLFIKEPEIGQRLLDLIQDNLKIANDKINSLEQQ